MNKITAEHFDPIQNAQKTTQSLMLFPKEISRYFYQTDPKMQVFVVADYLVADKNGKFSVFTNLPIGKVQHGIEIKQEIDLLNEIEDEEQRLQCELAIQLERQHYREIIQGGEEVAYWENCSNSRYEAVRYIALFVGRYTGTALNGRAFERLQQAASLLNRKLSHIEIADLLAYFGIIAPQDEKYSLFNKEGKLIQNGLVGEIDFTTVKGMLDYARQCGEESAKANLSHEPLPADPVVAAPGDLDLRNMTGLEIYNLSQSIMRLEPEFRVLEDTYNGTFVQAEASWEKYGYPIAVYKWLQSVNGKVYADYLGLDTRDENYGLRFKAIEKLDSLERVVERLRRFEDVIFAKFVEHYDTDALANKP